ncbi:MAG: hypothetical protein R2750_09325 [Bacteroidales bacterium]
MAVIFFLLVLYTPHVKAQVKKLSFAEVDKVSYDLYSAQNWDSLTEFSKVAFAEGFDYFYLRLRTGIAYFNKGNYFNAAFHLEKAYKFNKSDAVANEYLYFSLINSNRNLEAAKYAKKFNAEIKKEIGTDSTNFIRLINFETGPILSNNFSKNETNNLAGQDSLFGEQDLNGNKYYNQLGFGMNILPNVSFYVGYNNLIISKLKQIQTSDLIKTGYDTILDNGWYYVDTVYGRDLQLQENNYNFFQHSLYASAPIAAGKNWIITPSAHWLHINYKTLFAYSEYEYYFAQSYDTIQSVKEVFYTEMDEVKVINYVLSLALNKSYSIYNFGLFGSWSDLNYLNQYQAGAKVMVFPKGNLDLYTSAKFVSAWENGDNRLVFELIAGSKLSEKVWGEASIAFGQMKNFNENNAYIIYNSGDEITLRAGGNFIVPLSPKVQLSLRYQYLKLQGYRNRLTSNDKLKTSTISYNNNLLIGGLLWKF